MILSALFCRQVYAQATREKTPPNAVSTKTWTVGTQIWSDVINVPKYNKKEYNGKNADGRKNGSYGYLYSWHYVDANKSTLCPSPWRVPTKNDFIVLYKYLGGLDKSSLDRYLGRISESEKQNDLIVRNKYLYIWGGTYGGYCGSSGDLFHQGEYACYWTSTEESSYAAYCLFIYSDGDVTQSASDYKHLGLQVRCVK